MGLEKTSRKKYFSGLIFIRNSVRLFVITGVLIFVVGRQDPQYGLPVAVIFDVPAPRFPGHTPGWYDHWKKYRCVPC